MAELTASFGVTRTGWTLSCTDPFVMKGEATMGSKRVVVQVEFAYADSDIMKLSTVGRGRIRVFEGDTPVTDVVEWANRLVKKLGVGIEEIQISHEADICLDEDG